jgi:hypothetical protein
MPPRDLRYHRTRHDCLGNDPPLLPIAPPPAADHDPKRLAIVH